MLAAGCFAHTDTHTERLPLDERAAVDSLLFPVKLEG